MNITDQMAAQRLAMCNDIGEAAYVASLIAAALFTMLSSLPAAEAVAARLEERYHVSLQASENQTPNVCRTVVWHTVPCRMVVVFHVQPSLVRPPCLRWIQVMLAAGRHRRRLRGFAR